MLKGNRSTCKIYCSHFLSDIDAAENRLHEIADDYFCELIERSCCKRLLFIGSPPRKIRCSLEKCGANVDYIDIYTNRTGELAKKIRQTVQASQYLAIVYINNSSSPWVNLREEELILAGKVIKHQGYVFC